MLSHYEQERLGLAAIEAGHVEGPPRGPWPPGGAYPLAVDINADDGIAAVSFAILDMYPDIAPGWWCEVVTFSFRLGRWGFAGGESDNTTAPDPFSRPDKPANSVTTWLDWHSNGGLGGWSEDDPPPWRHTFFGIAPTGTHRLTVTDEEGRTRDLQITPWNGAYVAIVGGTHSTLTGYDQQGVQIGSIKPMDGFEQEPEPEPPPGWHAVEEDGHLLFRPKGPT